MQEWFEKSLIHSQTILFRHPGGEVLVSLLWFSVQKKYKLKNWTTFSSQLANFGPTRWVAAYSNFHCKKINNS